MTKHLYKNAFAVIGKAGQGPADNPQSWIPPLWDDANSHFNEITGVILKDDDGAPLVWGAMNNVDESNKRWDDTGKYMAGCEADVNAQPPDGWAKWIIPAQTYLVANCTGTTYGDVFAQITNDSNIEIIGTVHERYPEPGNPNVLELWFPVSGKCVDEMDK